MLSSASPNRETNVRMVAESSKLARGAWGVDEIDGIRNGQRCPLSSAAGLGVDVYILDSGCDATPGDGLCFRALATPLSNEPAGCTDGHGHGTHVGGITTSQRFGVAPKATRHCIKVLNRHNAGCYADIIAGIATAYKHHQTRSRPGVVNLSVAGPKEQTLVDAVMAAAEDKLWFVIAAGNRGQDACNVSPGRAAERDEFVLTVCAHDKNGRTPSFSNYGKCTDISAPGVDIASDNGVLSGTSQAAPHVAGAIAVLMSNGVRVSLESLTGSKVIQGTKKPALRISC